MNELKLRGGVAQLTNPANLAFGDAWRIWFPSQYLTPPDERFGTVTVNPTWQNFPHPVGGIARGDMSGYLKSIKDRNIKVIACCANGYDKRYDVPLKSLPLDNPTLDKTHRTSYTIYENIFTEMIRQFGRMGNSSVWAMQYLNEINNYSGAPYPEWTLTGAQYANLFYDWALMTWSLDANMIVISAPTARFDIVWLDSFWNRIVQLNAQDWFTSGRALISMNVYFFGGCGVWGTCDAKKPEEMQPLMNQVNTWLKDRGVIGLITEHGCNSEKQADLGYPNYGLNKYQSQAKLIIDSTDSWLEKSNIGGVFFYQLDDDAGERRFRFTGLCEDHPTTPVPKESYHIVKSAFSQPFEPSEKYAKIELIDNPNIIVE